MCRWVSAAHAPANSALIIKHFMQRCTMGDVVNLLPFFFLSFFYINFLVTLRFEGGIWCFLLQCFKLKNPTCLVRIHKCSNTEAGNGSEVTFAPKKSDLFWFSDFIHPQLRRMCLQTQSGDQSRCVPGRLRTSNMAAGLYCVKRGCVFIYARHFAVNDSGSWVISSLSDSSLPPPHLYFPHRRLRERTQRSVVGDFLPKLIYISW